MKIAHDNVYFPIIFTVLSNASIREWHNEKKWNNYLFEIMDLRYINCDSPKITTTFEYYVRVIFFLSGSVWSSCSTKYHLGNFNGMFV